MHLTSKYIGFEQNSLELVGITLLDLITSGMYIDPLIMYREYIQNAADAIELLPDPREGRIEIEIDAIKRNVRINDSGPGLSHQQAVEALVPISKSSKDYRHNRGFRGIGRMCGLAFAKSIIFRTRANAETTVTSILWDGDKLRNCIYRDFSIADTVSRCVRVEQRSIKNDPANFFEVELLGISRQAAVALNRIAVRDYISEVGPISFSGSFPFKAEVTKILEEYKSLYEIEIYLSDSSDNSHAHDISITRPHSGNMVIFGGNPGKFCELENVRIPRQSGESLAAIGWVAHSDYQGALPRSSGFRCLRARSGNIQIGGETVFDHLFSESRFNRWCVGEFHILDPEIIPNGSRDYFELNVHLRNLENHLRQVCRNIEKQCRLASRHRNQLRKLDALIEDAEAIFSLVSSGYLPSSDGKRLASQMREKLSANTQKCLIEESDIQQDQLDALRSKLDSIEKKSVNKLATRSAEEQRTYRNIFLALTETAPSLSKAKEMIESIMKFNRDREA